MGVAGVSADQGVNDAVAYLAAIATVPPATMRPGDLVREDGELRHHLRVVLQVIADVEDTEIDEEITQMTRCGGAHVAVSDAVDAADGLRAAAHCAESHLSLPRAAARYRQLAEAMETER